MVVNDDNTLRIDFTKIIGLSGDEGDKISQVELGKEESEPLLIFTGQCPEGRPDKIDPFIGIFSFEREDKA